MKIEREIFPYVADHVHASSIAELPNGDLISAWFQGSGERQADDVAIMGAWLPKGKREWTPPFVMADVPGFPDINPVLFVDDRGVLWLFWYTVIAGQWETSLLKYRVCSNCSAADGPPRWDWQDVIHLKPGDAPEHGIQPDDRFVAAVERKALEYARYLKDDLGATPDELAQWRDWSGRMIAKARGEDYLRKGWVLAPDGTRVPQEIGYPYFRRMGWQTKNKPVQLGDGRIILPLYSDGFDFSMMAITDDYGKTWQCSEPLVGAGNIQPSIAVRSNGNLVAFMRDNGPPPKRLHVSESTDQGMTWSGVKDSDLPNPGSGADLVTLANGHWVLAYNDTEVGRWSLAISVSTDEGENWHYTRHLEHDQREENASRSHYPSIIQGDDGLIHVVYSYHRNDMDTDQSRTIKHVTFDEDWVISGE